ncbi:MAG TPA: AAA family ATPase [Saprospiraceae bacterium]|nr:AAA family ATPase [Saprospiraceae bacterium]HMQ82067.1 AAA family ATPase [Saprospiraceae bacterium]
MNEQKAIQYWLFQSSPKVMRLSEALKAGAVSSFGISAHWDKIKAGDKAILYESGKNAACYALAEVRSMPEEQPIPEWERPFYLHEPDVQKRVALQIECNLWHQPISKERLLESPFFQDFHGSLPGSTFKSHYHQYRQILDWVEQLHLFSEPEVAYEYQPEFSHPHNLILYGPPGTGKTFKTLNHALSIIEQRPEEELALESRVALKQRFQYYKSQGRIGFVTFHPSFSYEDFVEGIKPFSAEGKVHYRIEDGIFKTLAARAQNDLESFLQKGSQAAALRNYVLIMDEFNRGNIAAIFGELLTLIDSDKRKGMAEALEVILPYSRQNFSVPANLYLIGTMNTADRSAETLDMALRRRFSFREMPAEPDKIAALADRPGLSGINLVKLLDTINYRIELLLSKDYHIGHAYFLNVNNLDELKQVFDQQVLPLLQEYFFNDLGKIGLVLGKAFVREKDGMGKKNPFADFDGFAGEMAYSEKKLYELRSPEAWTEADFIGVYEDG